ncbi:hypothetical protein DPMN_124321 [Dreissena polymorpha]|uniref:Uncharacterized protein n=1 Tax=Dreissena polymorpha TaxID=45954 RepID=A0A9D4GTB5_DREPO|nr:hypothetical protein DPMN_124321 [Dreissena polymorpha]
MSRFIRDTDFYNARCSSRLNDSHDAIEEDELTEELPMRTPGDGMETESVASGMKRDRICDTFWDTDEGGYSESESDVSDLNKKMLRCQLQRHAHRGTLLVRGRERLR